MASFCFKDNIADSHNLYFIAVGIPISVLKLSHTFTPKIVRILTWGGLRGGISIALVLTVIKSIKTHPSLKSKG